MSSTGSSDSASGQPAADEEKSQSFRKRRLSLPMHSSPPEKGGGGDEVQQATENAAATTAASASSACLEMPPDIDELATGVFADDEDSSQDASKKAKAQSFRKRRLSLPNLLALAKAASEEGNDSSDAPPAKRSRRDSATSVATSASGRSEEKVFPSKTLHASELLNYPLPSPAVHANSILYDLQPILLPPQTMLPAATEFSPASAAANAANSTTASATTMIEPKWKRRITVRSKHEEHKLPFPRDIVGTYSCHGVEPVYDGSYEPADDDDDWDEDGDDDDDDDDDDGEEDDGEKDDSPYKPAGAASTMAATTGLTIDTSNPDQVPLPPPAQSLQIQRAAMAAKINQDRGGIAFPYGNCPRMALFAVYDGHGQGGELVSQYVLTEMQRRLEKHESFDTDLEKAFIDTFHAIDEGLKTEQLIEPVYAGTTACVALLKQNKLTLANCGDSRAVVAKKRIASKSSSAWKALALTVDQNPDLPEEMERILSAGGYVTGPPAPGLSARVWLDASCTQIGLAMARSLGDHAVSDVGVIATPVVTTYTVDADDEFLILASDGVWEFLKSQDAVEIVGANLDRGATKACQALIEAAAAKWHEEEGEYRDDITAIVVRLQKLWDNDSEVNK